MLTACDSVKYRCKYWCVTFFLLSTTFCQLQTFLLSSEQGYFHSKDGEWYGTATSWCSTHRGKWEFIIEESSTKIQNTSFKKELFHWKISDWLRCACGHRHYSGTSVSSGIYWYSKIQSKLQAYQKRILSRCPMVFYIIETHYQNCSVWWILISISIQIYVIPN